MDEAQEIASFDRNELYDQFLTNDVDIADTFEQDDVEMIALWLEEASPIVLDKAIKSFERVERYRVCARLLHLKNNRYGKV